MGLSSNQSSDLLSAPNGPINTYRGPMEARWRPDGGPMEAPVVKSGPPRLPGGHRSDMDRSRVSDFSIERILSPQLGRKQLQPPAAPDGYLRGVPGGFSLEPARPWAPVVPVPVPGCLQYRGARYGDGFCPCAAAFHHLHAEFCFCAHFGPKPTAGSDAAQAGYQQPGGGGPLQKVRMRTVFTDSQTKQLEALFQLTDYPATEARAQLARNAGLSEETVRIWFKNRRARRKRQRSGSKVRSPCPSPERKTCSSFL